AACETLRYRINVQFTAADGFTPHGTLYEGGPDAILIASALGVKRRDRCAGGQLAGFAENASAIARLVFVAAQAGYYGNYPGVHRHSIRAIWHAMPFVSRVMGYFPSRALGLGSEDLPLGVATQWATWGKHPKYLFGFEDASRYASMNVPLLAWSFEGDWYAP